MSSCAEWTSVIAVFLSLGGTISNGVYANLDTLRLLQVIRISGHPSSIPLRFLSKVFAPETLTDNIWTTQVGNIILTNQGALKPCQTNKQPCHQRMFNNDAKKHPDIAP
ncbi:hypothetical protein BDR04DRAFT_1162666 [Suillus decipiens]|nr:hypothetical protein BDR04DRAFT_1162666 [Suillus decipiens]